MSDTIYPKGIIIFKKNENAPDFVKGSMVITVNELVKFCKENADLLTEYNGQKQLKCQLLDGNNGLYLKVDTWKPNQQQNQSNATIINESNESEDLPF